MREAAAVADLRAVPASDRGHEPVARACLHAACDLLRVAAARPLWSAIGGLGFILPGLIVILALSVLFLGGSPPSWIRGAGMGAGAAVAAVAVRAGVGVAAPIYRRAARGPRVLAYMLLGAVAAATRAPG